MSYSSSIATSSPHAQPAPTPERTATRASPGARDAQLATDSFWVINGVLPFAVSVIVLLAIHYGGIDTRLASHFYDIASGKWIGADTWWASTVLHDGGRWLVRIIAFGALFTWLTTFLGWGSHKLRRQAAYVATAIILCTGIVGTLKAITNVDCPWDLALYGGDRPLIPWFAARPDNLPHAQCFPGAHSSSGFSLLCLYFLFADRGKAIRWVGLLTGLVLGGLFSFAQQARGAHFLSHDVWSAVICWYVVLVLYATFQRKHAARWSGA